MKEGDILFLDTNILLSATDESRVSHEAALAVFPVSFERGIHLALSGQVIREYLAVATRSLKENGFGLDVQDALANIKKIRNRAVFLDETEEVSKRLLQLVSKFDIRGKRVHDANIVATMQAHSVKHILTGNMEDFTVFTMVESHSLEQFLHNP